LRKGKSPLQARATTVLDFAVLVVDATVSRWTAWRLPPPPCACPTPQNTSLYLAHPAGAHADCAWPSAALAGNLEIWNAAPSMLAIILTTATHLRAMTTYIRVYF
jgi:hypothetical protein